MARNVRDYMYGLLANSGYINAIASTLDVRLDRKKIYGDDWKESEDWQLLALIKEKTDRLKGFIINGNREKNKENKIDTLIDLANYSLMLLENEINKK